MGKILTFFFLWIKEHPNVLVQNADHIALLEILEFKFFCNMEHYALLRELGY